MPMQLQIRDLFKTNIEERVEPVVKVTDRRPTILLSELNNLIVTPQWEHHLRLMLAKYTDACEREDVQGIGFWISGFFGSGKSLLMKVLGALLQGDEIQGTPVHELFLPRVLAESARSELGHILSICHGKIKTTLVGGNLHTQQAWSADPLTVIVFRLFSEGRGYTPLWPFAWTVEYELDTRGLTDQFRSVVSGITAKGWGTIMRSPAYYSRSLYAATAQLLPDTFESAEAVAQAVNLASREGITPNALIDRLTLWCQNEDGQGYCHKLLLQLDELGQWFNSGNDPHDRPQQVQALVEEAATRGQGRIWIAVTAHGDVQMMIQSLTQESYMKINQRFAAKCKLSNEDIDEVVTKRLLLKKGGARSDLGQLFDDRSGQIIDLGTIRDALRPAPPLDAENFAKYYPYLPWTVALVPEIVKGIARSTGQEDALSGSNRTMIGVVQGGIIDAQGLLNEPLGRVLSLAELYDQLATDAPNETKTDLAQVQTSGDDPNFTTRVARALYLLGQAGYSPNLLDQPRLVPCTLDNIARALVDSLDVDLPALRTRVEEALKQLVNARYAKRVGDGYEFLNAQQRNFQDKVLNRVNELRALPYDLSRYLQTYTSSNPLRIARVSISGTSKKERTLKMELDGYAVRTGAPTSEAVTIKLFSPLQRLLDFELENDEAMKLRSGGEPNNIFLRMGKDGSLREALALAVATEEVGCQIISTRPDGDAEKGVAQYVLQKELPLYKQEVSHALAQAIKGSVVFFKGSDEPIQLMYGESPTDAVRNRVGYWLSYIYTRFSELPDYLGHDEAIVRAALKGDTTQCNLRDLHIFNADGSLNRGHPLLVALVGKLPQAENDQGMISADRLRSEFEQPPFGWDGNWVKVGLALLLHTGACRLYIQGTYYTDPGQSEVMQALTKEQDFKSLRVQAIHNSLDKNALRDIRVHIETVFRIRPPLLVAASLSNEVEGKLKVVDEDARELEKWEMIARCPLPNEFVIGKELVESLLDTTAPDLRLTLFEQQWQQLLQYIQLQEVLQKFKVEHSTEYVELRDFYNSMRNVEECPEAVQAFLEDWNVVHRERSVTNLARWEELKRAYLTAKQAIERTIVGWQQDYLRELAELQAPLSERLQDAGVPADKITSEANALIEDLRPLQELLERTGIDFSEALNMRKMLATARLHVQRRIREASARHQLAPDRPVSAVAVASEELRCQWRELMGPVRISSTRELEAVLNTLKRLINEELGHQRTVIIE